VFVNIPSRNFTHSLIVKKQSRARLLLVHPVLYILKPQKIYCTFWKQPFKNQPKSVIGYVPQLALSPKVGQAVQLESSKCNISAVFPRVKRINTTAQQHKCRKLFKSFPQGFTVISLASFCLLLASHATCWVCSSFYKPCFDVLWIARWSHSADK